MKKVFRNVFTAAFLLLILIGCSTTKRIADDEVLYTGVRKNGDKTVGHGLGELKRQVRRGQSPRLSAAHYVQGL